MSESPQRGLDARLRQWGIVEVIEGGRGAVIESHVRAEVTVIKRRVSFTSHCLDCGASEHVSIDDHAVAICLRCGRDKWL